MPRPGIVVGALCGALVTAGLIASLFLAYALAGLPFVPCQIFDRAARTLPGSLIRFGIETMVSVIRGLRIGETSWVAKTAEQAMAIVGFLVIGTLAGALLFAICRPQAGRWPGRGIVLGLLLGVPAAWIAATVEQASTTGPVVVRADERVMLTSAWDGLPLARPHGFPLRIYIPDHYGMKQPKWIDSLEAIDAWEPGYWVQRGWDREARMRATSVIHTLAMAMMVVEPDKTVMIPIGGIVHAGRGISRVEVSVDGRPWERTLLRDPLSPTTWVIWRYDWPFRPGKHTFTVRCFEGDGTPQIVAESPISPNGATGLDSVTRIL